MNGLSDKSHATHGSIQFLFHSELSVSHSKLAWLNVIPCQYDLKRFKRNKTATFDSNCIEQTVQYIFHGRWGNMKCPNEHVKDVFLT